jgi:hypothetical protein
MGHIRVEQISHFENARRQTRWWRLWRQLSGKPSTLLPFWPIHARLKQRTGFPGGIHEIKLRQIVGSLDKDHLFDKAFHPLSDRQRDRWIAVKMLQETVGWEPIKVHMVGNLYFVEDGHHRVSVAREAGLSVIEADVVAYQLDCHFDLDADLDAVLRRIDACEALVANETLEVAAPVA